MKEERYRWDIRKEFVIAMVGCNNLPKKIMDVPSLEEFKDKLWFKSQCAV